MGKAMGLPLKQLRTAEMPSGVLPKMSDQMSSWIDYVAA